MNSIQMKNQNHELHDFENLQTRHRWERHNQNSLFSCKLFSNASDLFSFVRNNECETEEAQTETNLKEKYTIIFKMFTYRQTSYYYSSWNRIEKSDNSAKTDDCGCKFSARESENEPCLLKS